MGDYISVQRPAAPRPWGDDLVVRQVWWRLDHPETRAVVPENTELIGTLHELFVECDQAIGPWSSDAWRDSLESAEQRGIKIEKLKVARYSCRQSDLPGAAKERPTG